MITVGILVAYIVDAILASSGAWRWMLGLAAIPAIVLLVGMYFMPETPRWLMSRNREDEARDVLLRSRTEEETEEEIQDIKEVEREEAEGGLKELAASWVRPALIVAIGLAAFQQFVGVNTIIYYAPTTFTKVGFTAVQAIYGEALIGVINVVMTLVAIWLIDRLGRKPLLLAGVVGMVLSLAVLGFSHFFLPQPSSLTDPEAIITFVCTATYIISFAATWGPVVWVMLPEVLPLRIRGTAMGAAVFANWVSNFIVSQTFPILLSAWGPGFTFLAYAGMGVLAFLFVYTLVTETKGRSLEQIETDLRKKTSFSTGEGEGAVH
jgi:SP family sugar:H+ symporter-like MFS transporter